MVPTLNESLKTCVLSTDLDLLHTLREDAVFFSATVGNRLNRGKQFCSCSEMRLFSPSINTATLCFRNHISQFTTFFLSPRSPCTIFFLSLLYLFSLSLSSFNILLYYNIFGLLDYYSFKSNLLVLILEHFWEVLVISWGTCAIHRG